MKICLMLNEKNIINGYGIGKNTLKNGINVETDISLEELCGNYKYENNKLIKLTEEEKESLFPIKENEESETIIIKKSEFEKIQNDLLETQAVVAELQANILLNQGGIA